MKDLWKDLKKRPAILIGLGFAIIAVLYIVYKSNAGNSQASGTNSQTGTNGQGTAGQLGGYIQFEEDVMNPPNVSVTLGGGTTKTRIVHVGDDDKRKRTPVPSHKPPIKHKDNDHSPDDRKPSMRGGLPVAPGGKSKVIKTPIVNLKTAPIHNSRKVG